MNRGSARDSLGRGRGGQCFDILWLSMIRLDGKQGMEDVTGG